MNWEQEQSILDQAGATIKASLFAIHGDLDGEKESEFVEREQFIGLVIGKEEFMLSIANVREIIMLTPITYVPNAPEFVDGVINLRGTILPAINVRKMMGLSHAKPTLAARIIITRFEDVTFGLIVDGITYVVSLLPSEIEHQNLPGKGTGAEFIGSISKQGEKIAGILDIARLLRGASGDLLEQKENDEEEDGNEAA
jgi:purine-binding chemotaxis protein CheW